jgi:hypothetical protein
MTRAWTRSSRTDPCASWGSRSVALALCRARRRSCRFVARSARCPGPAPGAKECMSLVSPGQPVLRTVRRKARSSFLGAGGVSAGAVAAVRPVSLKRCSSACTRRCAASPRACRPRCFETRSRPPGPGFRALGAARALPPARAECWREPPASRGLLGEPGCILAAVALCSRLLLHRLFAALLCGYWACLLARSLAAPGPAPLPGEPPLLEGGAGIADMALPGAVQRLTGRPYGCR